MLKKNVLRFRSFLANRPVLFTQAAILVWAAILGIAGALTTAAFHESIKLLQVLHSGVSGDAVEIAGGVDSCGALIDSYGRRLDCGALSVFSITH